MMTIGTNETGNLESPGNKKFLRQRILDGLSLNPEAVALRFGDRQLIYAQLRDRIRQVSDDIIERNNSESADHFFPRTAMDLQGQEIIDCLSVILGHIIAGVPLTFGDKPALKGNDRGDTVCYLGGRGPGNEEITAVPVKFQTLEHVVSWASRTAALAPGSPVGLMSPISEPDTLIQILAAIVSGSIIDIMSEDGGYCAWIRSGRIKWLCLAPEQFRDVIKEKPEPNVFSSLTHIFIRSRGRDKLLPGDVKEWYAAVGSRVQLVHIYGHVETGLIDACHFIDQTGALSAAIPVGLPVEPSEILVLDEDLEECDDEFAGDIYIKTPLMTPDFTELNQTEASLFIRDPQSEEPEDIMFRTGDTGRWLGNGYLEVITAGEMLPQSGKEKGKPEGMKKNTVTPKPVIYGRTTIPAVEKKEYYPLSSAQKRLFILQEMERDSTAYHMYSVIPLHFVPSIDVLNSTLIRMIARHEILRTSFIRIDDRPVQRVHDISEITFKVDDYELRDGEELEQSRFIRSFRLEEAPLMRSGIIRLPGGTCIWWKDVHHIISDGLSSGVFTRELTALLQGETLLPLRIQYKDFSEWQNCLFREGGIREQERFWLDMYDDAPDLPRLNLPADGLRPEMFTFEGDSYSFELTPAESTAFLQMGSRNMATLYMNILAVLNVLFYKYTGQTDVIIGSVVAGRSLNDLKELLGMFANTLAMRNYPLGCTAYCDFLQDVSERCLQAFNNQDYPFDELVDRLGLKRGTAYNPLFDVCMVVQNLGSFEGADQENDAQVLGKDLPGVKKDQITSKFDMTVFAYELGNKIKLAIEYYKPVFSREMIVRMANHLKRIITTVSRTPSLKLDDIDLMGREEKKKILSEFNREPCDWNHDGGIYRLIENTSACRPGATAVGFGEYVMTFGHLTTIAGLISRDLRFHGRILPGEPVGVWMDPDLLRPAALLGILEAGGAFVPLEPSLPERRLITMVKDANIRVILSLKKHARDLDRLKLECACFEYILYLDGDDLYAEAERESSEPIVTEVNGETTAYIIYTSGTSGVPRGVAVTHRGLVNLCFWHNRFFNVTPRDRASLYAGFGFDASVWELFPYLVAGAQVEIIPDAIRLDPVLINAYFQCRDITIGFLPTQMCERFMELDNTSLRALLTGGDKLRRFQSRSYTLYNNYGPTENTVVTTVYQVNENYYNIPIGKPVDNCRVYIVDRDYRHLQPVGIPGELCISGDGVAKGYLNNPAATAEKFIEGEHHPFFNTEYPELYAVSLKGYDSKMKNTPASFSANNGIKAVKRLYSTGDSARWLPNGNIEFLGRLDSQVKVRGFRIEIGEIETRLLAHPLVEEAVVLAFDFLCAYVVVSDTLETGELQEFLRKHLPEYMVPVSVFQIDKIPLTSSGKVDRKSLPAPVNMQNQDSGLPVTDTEKKLAELWAGVLGIDISLTPVGRNANFFELGGHSLKATILVSRIHKELGIKMPLTDVFRHQSLADMAAVLKELQNDARYSRIEPVEKREYYPLSSAQKRIYFVQSMDRESTAYNMPMRVPMGRYADVVKLEQVFRKLIERHEALRTSFRTINGDPVQVIHDRVKFSVETAENKEAYAFASQPFDLSIAPLMRVLVQRQGSDDYILIVDIHHIISDGTSHMVLAEDFQAMYNDKELEPLRLHYKDYSHWQSCMMSDQSYQTQESYWLSMLADSRSVPRLEFPTNRERPRVFSFKGEAYGFILPRNDAEAFKRLNLERGGTLYMNILAAINTLFYLYSGQTDIIIGSGTAGRPHTDLEKVVGMFVNMLPMRNSPGGEKTYCGFLEEVIEHSVAALENQDVQFETLVDKLGVERDPSRNPIFDVAIVVQNFRESGNSEPVNNVIDFEEHHDGQPQGIRLGGRSSKFDITFMVQESGEDVAFVVEYYTGILDMEFIQRMVSHLLRLIHTVSYNPSICLKEIEIIGEEEKEKILRDFNGESCDWRGDGTICGLFGDTAARLPGTAAVVYRNRIMTYGHLYQVARQIARYLAVDKKLLPGEPVGVWMEPDLLRPVAVLGVLEAGGAFVPLDPSLPVERLKMIINDANIRVIVSGKRYIRDLNRLQWECPGFDHFLLLDSYRAYAEEEAEPSELMDMELWHHVGEIAVDDITGGGWTSSFTGEPLSREEMDEYGDNVLEKVKPLLHKNMKVLEIGCASGISMFRIAPLVERYVGTDLSAVIIEKNKQRLQKESITNIRLEHLAAHETGELDENRFDLVIINSVIQCFHGHNYLRRVLRLCIEKLSDSGYLFLGDIMDQDSKHILLKELETFKYDPANRDKGYKTKTDFSSELFLPRAFWSDFQARYPEIKHVGFSDKIHTIKNELTRFRYDVLIHVDKTGEVDNRLSVRKHQEDCSFLRESSLPFQSPVPDSDSTAYIIYTSGSTGVPRGVPVTHRGLINLCFWHNRYYRVTPRDRASQYAGFGFDASVWELFPYLVAGIPVEIIPGDIRLDPEAVNHYFETRDITVAFLPTQMCEQFMELNNTSLRILLTGGDKLDRFKPQRYTLYNNYGPTENTVVSTACPVTQNSFNIPIGKPVANCRVYILDYNYRHIQPIGVPGELCITGSGLAGGYLNNPVATAEKFFTPDLYIRKSEPDYIEIQTPNITSQSQSSLNNSVAGKAEGLSRKDSIVSSTRMIQSAPPVSRRKIFYKTGDSGRWLDDGNIEFLGRIDTQVKVRGFRIEIGEIETRLLMHPMVKEAVVVVLDYLCAYIVVSGPVETAELQEYLGLHLPGYMVPVGFVILDSIPLTVSGKVDRRALPSPDISRQREAGTKKTEMETKLAVIWAGVLGIEGGSAVIGRDDNFFDLGGHSLKATILISRIHKELGIKLPLPDVFRHQSLASMAAAIKGIEIQTRYSGIEPVETRDFYPLSSAQLRMYFLQVMNTESTAYNTPMTIPLGEEPDLEKLDRAFRTLINRHEALRTYFRVKDGGPVQVIAGEVDFCLEIDEDDTAPFKPVPFDLSKAPLMRVAVKRRSDGHYFLVVDIHHIISDGTSQALLIDDFQALYNGEVLHPLKLHYKDYSLWQNRVAGEESYLTQQSYWLTLYGDSANIPRLDLPTDRERPKFFTFQGASYIFTLPRQDAEAFKQLHSQRGGTLYMNILAALNTLFFIYTGQTDIIIGSGTAGRPHADLEKVVGMFINMLPMRNHPDGEKTYEEFLDEVIEQSLQALENQDVQFETLVDRLGVERDPSRNPLFDVSMVVQNFRDVLPGGYEQTEEENGFRGRFLGETLSKFDLTFMGREAGNDIVFLVEYYTAIYDLSSVRQMVSHLVRLIHTVSHQPSIRLKDIDVIQEQEKKSLLAMIYGDERDFPQEKTVYDIFRDRVDRCPDGAALVYNDTVVTYGQLDARAGQLAVGLFHDNNIKAGGIIGLLLSHPLLTGVAILGTWKAGAAYVPMDPELPLERLGVMLRDTAVSTVITETRYGQLFNRLRSHSSYLETAVFLDNHSGPEASVQNYEPAVTGGISPELPAYIIYTSGSTGRPKGVVVEHRGVVNTLLQRVAEYRMDQNDGSLQLFPYVFDGFITGFFTPLVSGGRVVVIDREDTTDTEVVRDTMIKKAVSHMICVPGLFSALMEVFTSDHLKWLKTVCLAGEKPGDRIFAMARQKSPNLEIANEYGVTEASVMSTVYRNQQQNKQIQIGKPVPNTAIFIVNSYLKLQPIGIAGEMIITGAGVARGYLNRPELTAVSFLDIDRHGLSTKTLTGGFIGGTSGFPYANCYYRSGDLGRFLSDGNIEFLGRIDSQVKIRGFRIETGEIEARLMELDGIGEAAVIKRSEGAEGYLCAYVANDGSTDTETLNEGDIKNRLAEVLPRYMVPAYIVFLDKLPLTGTGKIDRQKLPEPGPVEADEGYEPPVNDIEEQLVIIYADVLGLEPEVVSVVANFFEIGGHSLNLIKVNNRVNEAFDIKISITTFFNLPTIRQIAGYIGAEVDHAKDNRSVSTGIIASEPVEIAKGSMYRTHTNDNSNEVIRHSTARNSINKSSCRGPGGGSFKKSPLAAGGTEIAVIGMAVRFPGASGIREFWSKLEDGVECISFYSREELIESGIDAGVVDAPGYVRAGVCLDGKEYFDASFFGYLPGEARVMDPKVRLFHECVWEALEDGGYVPDYFPGEIGLYGGAESNFFWELTAILAGVNGGEGSVDGFSSAQLRNRDFLTTRVAYRLNLRGPAVFVQTACSTSLTAIHLACRALLSGECDMALAGGVTISGGGKSGYLYREGMIFSPDGHCRAFDAEAKGTINGEGAGVVLLKPLERALEDRDCIRAVVKGSAINNDGINKVGFAAPGVSGQADVIRKAQAAAGVEAGSISYIEAHGTGTVLGDPVEVEALGMVFGKANKETGKYCGLGSVKTNMGHMDAAAGVAGFVKTVLALQHRKLPPSLHFNTPNPRIDFQSLPFYVVDRLTDWRHPGYPLRAGVSSFGIGGTNVHVVLEEAPAVKYPEEKRYRLMALSARSKTSLERMTGKLEDFFASVEDISMRDTAYTLQTGRKAFSKRRFFIARDREEATRILGDEASGKVKTGAILKTNRVTVFMFPGQGAQYERMGQELYRSFPVFKRELDRCFEILDTHSSGDEFYRSYKSYLSYRSDDESNPGTVGDKELFSIDDTEITQPVMVSFQYALARLLMDMGIEPGLMVGHSIGEYTAACLSGVISLENMLTLAALRGRLMQELERGSMMAVPLPEAEVLELLTERETLSLAAVNSPEACVVSGTGPEIDELNDILNGRGINCRRLHTSHAFHSPMMDPILSPFREAVGKVAFTAPGIPYMSNVTGGVVSTEEVTEPSYWVRHLRDTVRFGENIRRLPLKTGLNAETPVFIEVGPGTTLSTFVRQIIKAANPPDVKAVKPPVLNLIRHPKEKVDDTAFLMERLGEMWLSGITPDWQKLYPGEEPGRVSLPTYAFEKKKYPVDASAFGGMGTLLGHLAQSNGMQTGTGFPGMVPVQPEMAGESTEGDMETEIDDERPDLTTPYVAPKTEMEKKLVKIWQDFFEIKGIGIVDNFFELGGDSLKATLLGGRIREALHVEVPVAEFFARPTIKELAEYLDGTGETVFRAIEPVEDKEYYPVSSAQRRVYFRHQVNPGITIYNMPQMIPVEGDVDPVKLQEAVNGLIARHESLRTSFLLIDGVPMQRIHKTARLQIEALTDFSRFVRPFDLGEVPLLRLAMGRNPDGTVILAVDIHHIITDGISSNIIHKDLQLIQAGSSLTPIKVRYRDYTQWQYDLIRSENMKSQAAYWHDQFRDVPPRLSIPQDFPPPGPGMRTYSGGQVNFTVNTGLTATLRKLSTQQGTTLHVVLLAAFTLLLSRYSGQEDIVVGIGIAGRRHPGLESVVGLFINALPMRNRPTADSTFEEFLHTVHENSLSAYENQEYPFEELVRTLNVQSHSTGNPLFDAAFQLQNLAFPKPGLPEEPKPEPPAAEIAQPQSANEPTGLIARYDLTIYAMETDGVIPMQLVYAAELYKRETAVRISEHFLEILETITTKMERKLKDINITIKLATADTKVLEQDDGDFDF